MGPSLVERGGKPALAAFRARPFEQPRNARRRPGGHRQEPRVDEREHAFAREHEAGAAETHEMRDACDHNRQPECSATTPPVIGVNETRRKPAASIMRGEGLRLRKFADRFDEILIGFAVAGHRLSDARDHAGRNRVRRARRDPARRPKKIPGREIGRRSCSTRKASASARSIRGTLRMPNAMVTQSKLRSE